MTLRDWVPPTREEILDCLRQADGPLTPQELARQLDVPDVHFDQLDKRLVAMERHDREPALFALEESYDRLRRLRARSEGEPDVAA